MDLLDLKIAGSGTIASGTYNKISIAGSASSNGDITCQLLKVAGSSSFSGDVDANEIAIAGSTKFIKNLKSNKIKIAGAVKVMGDLSSEELKIDGAINVEGECNVGVLQHEGEGSKYNNIYGEYIKLTSKRRKKITVNEIEATTIELKAVEAKRISGDTIKLEGKCSIDVIEFRNSLQLSKSVEVKEIVKL